MTLKIACIEDVAGYLSQFTKRSEEVHWLSDIECARAIHLNPAYEKIWGRESAPLYKSTECWIDNLLPDDIKDYHPLHRMAEQVARLGAEAKWKETYRIVRPNKEIRWIVDRGHSVCDSNNHVIGVTGIAIDITDDKKIIENTLEGLKFSFPNSITLAEFSQILQHKIMPGWIVPNNSQLTQRQWQCVIYMLKGYKAKQIAKALNVSPRTIEHHIENIKEKFGCKSSMKLIDFCWGKLEAAEKNHR